MTRIFASKRKRRFCSGLNFPIFFIHLNFLNVIIFDETNDILKHSVNTNSVTVLGKGLAVIQVLPGMYRHMYSPEREVMMDKKNYYRIQSTIFCVYVKGSIASILGFGAITIFGGTI